MNAFEIIRRDLELNTYGEDVIVDNPKTSTSTLGSNYGRKFLSISTIISCGQNKLDHPDAMRGDYAIPDDVARRAQRFTLPEDDAYLLGWAYHLYTLGMNNGDRVANLYSLMEKLEGTEANEFIKYFQSPSMRDNKDTLGIKNNIQLRLRMKKFLEKWGQNIDELDRINTSYRIINYMLLWNEIFNQ
jgi:hypothetical protein